MTVTADSAAPATSETTDHPRHEVRTYGSLIGAFVVLIALASGGRRYRPPRLADVAIIGLASHDIARIVARDRITRFLRSPFASGAAAQHPRGEGIRRAVGELLTCPHCLSLWIAGALTGASLSFPRRSRFVSAVFAGHALGNGYEFIALRFNRSTTSVDRSPNGLARKG
jgi:hypothetical protein